MKSLRFLLTFIVIAYACPLFSNHEASIIQLSPSSSPSGSQPNSVVFISCSGKAGSCTLEASFKATGIETSRCHTIGPVVVDRIMQKLRVGNVILIDSIRDIISRKIASFFQNLTTHLNSSAQDILTYYKKHPVLFTQTLKKKFKQKFLILETYNGFNSWQLFQYNCLTDGVFDFEKKYQLHQIGNLYFVNLRFDDIKDWGKIIKSIDLPLDLSQFRIVASNQANDKWYANIYRDFLANFTLTQQEFDTILSAFSEELAHFYTAKEIDAFIEKWTPYIE